MALSSRTKRQLHEAGFVDITGLRPNRPDETDTKVHKNEFENLVVEIRGHSTVTFSNIMFTALLHLQDRVGGQATVPVDVLVTEGGEVWVAQIHTSSIVKIRPLIRKVCKRENNLNMTGSFSVKAEDFLMALAPKMGWALNRK